MDDPVTELPRIIRSLTTSTAAEQRETLEQYFLADVAFDHPLCYVPSMQYPLNSRLFVLAIYRWHKKLSPVVEIEINSVAFDEGRNRAYVDQTQIFRHFYLPPVLRRRVADYVTVVDLEQSPDSGKYYIAAQKDLYQVEEWLGYFPFVGYPLRWLVRLMKLLSTGGCVVGAVMLGLLGMVLASLSMASQGEVSLPDRDKAQEEELRFERRIMAGFGKD